MPTRATSTRQRDAEPCSQRKAVPATLLGPGYGFGLGIVKELVELYGGDLELGHSRKLGGLLARVTVPRGADET